LFAASFAFTGVMTVVVPLNVLLPDMVWLPVIFTASAADSEVFAYNA
jgi:hypothetical protein